MLYQWGSSSRSTTTIFLPEEELKQEEADQTPPFFLDQYHHQCLTGTDHEELISNSPSIYHPLHPYYHPQQQVPAPNYLELLCSHPYSRAHLESPMLPTTELPMPKLEEELAYARNDGHRLPVHIGLNLGGRTYFSTLSSPCEVDLGCGFFQRPRFVKQRSENSPRCQAEGCASDLSLSKLYYRRHKVCEFHSKASSVVAAGITQRFCQQCSRFHDLSEFDQEKRSCRKRLAEHNRRRRKPQPPQGQSQTNIPGFYMASRYLSESGGITDSSSVTVAALSPLIALECLRAGQPDASCSSSCLRLSADYRPLDPQL